MKRIGIDVGGTNTDAVLLADGKVVEGVKTVTTADVTGGIVAAFEALKAVTELGSGIDAPDDRYHAFRQCRRAAAPSDQGCGHSRGAARRRCAAAVYGLAR